MESSTLSPLDNWRGIILLGKNTATYKIALAKCLIKFRKPWKKPYFHG